MIKDEYILGHSAAKSLSGMAEAIRIDLTLNPNPFLQAGSISGTIRDAFGNPIPDAVVLVMDDHGITMANSLAAADGSFIFTSILPGGGYRLYAMASGYNLAESLPFNFTARQNLTLDMILIPEPDTAASIVAGEVQNSHGFPIKSASVELYKLEGDTPKLLSLSLTNEIGQFVFRDLGVGSYSLRVNASGYHAGIFPVEIHSNHSIARVDAILNIDPKASQGIITGIISDTDDLPVANADVILYRVGNDQSLTPVAYTRTNHEGIYLFVNIPQGEYRINSNRSITLD